jgi:hypothetical protein
MFTSFLNKLRGIVQPSPPTEDIVTFDDVEVRCTRRSGKSESVRWDDLRGVLLETTDQGPFVDDMFWILVGTSGGCIVPSEAKGCQELMARLQQLPGFDNEAIIRASQLTSNNRLLCWKHPDVDGESSPGAS